MARRRWTAGTNGARARAASPGDAFAQSIARGVALALRPELEAILAALVDVRRNQAASRGARGIDEHARARAAVLRVLGRKGEMRKRDVARLTGLAGYRLKKFTDQLLAEGVLRRKGYARGTVYLRG